MKYGQNDFGVEFNPKFLPSIEKGYLKDTSYKNPSKLFNESNVT